jgi:hypothetical protein
VYTNMPETKLRVTASNLCYKFIEMLFLTLSLHRYINEIRADWYPTVLKPNYLAQAVVLLTSIQ